jgi:hypothetical protein
LNLAGTGKDEAARVGDATMLCEKCGKELPAGSEFCTLCNETIGAEGVGNMFCTKCGKENKDDASFCVYCGMTLRKEETPSPTRGLLAEYRDEFRLSLSPSETIKACQDAVARLGWRVLESSDTQIVCQRDRDGLHWTVRVDIRLAPETSTATKVFLNGSMFGLGGKAEDHLKGEISPLRRALELAESEAVKRSLKIVSAELEEAKASLKQLADRFAPLLEIEAEVAKARESADTAKAEADRAKASLNAEIEALRAKYTTGLAKFEELSRTVRSLEESLDNIEVGLYKPHFTYADSESYKRAIGDTRQEQKDLIRNGGATICGTKWTVGGSVSEGERMVKQTNRLILRAFNAESEAAVANVSWNNYNVMQARIDKAFEALNKLNTVIQVQLTEEYRQARLKELRLVFENAEKRQQEREEQRRQREAQREEERVQRDLQREQEAAEKDAAAYDKAIAQAQRDLASARDSEREVMQSRIAALETDLTAAIARKERAIAQAQLTKSGHVYIISNIGAFGEGVVKIGLTRRLEPEERVRELGDASVPFPFDIHALMYSENAPELEAKLQNHFWGRRLNWSNDRKEFFKVDLHEVQNALTEIGLQSELLMVPEAREYRETLALINESQHIPLNAPSASDTNNFPVNPFEGPSSH